MVRGFGSSMRSVSGQVWSIGTLRPKRVPAIPIVGLARSFQLPSTVRWVSNRVATRAPRPHRRTAAARCRSRFCSRSTLRMPTRSKRPISLGRWAQPTEWSTVGRELVVRPPQEVEVERLVGAARVGRAGIAHGDSSPHRVRRGDVAQGYRLGVCFPASERLRTTSSQYVSAPTGALAWSRPRWCGARFRRRMTDEATLGTTAVRTLAAIRLVNGTLGLLAPQLLVRRTSTDPYTTGALLRLPDVRRPHGRPRARPADPHRSAQERARTQAVLIHAADTAAALVGGLRGDVTSTGRAHHRRDLGLNTVLAVVAKVSGPKD